MQVTEIRVFLKEGPDKKLKAYVTVTFDHVFVVRNIKVIEGNHGLFIAMPSRKARENCPKCHFKNEVGARFCSQCGVALPATEHEEKRDAKADHRDIAHPVTQEFRSYLQSQILEAYERQVSQQSSPGVSPEPGTSEPSA